jgi:acyl carrier protein
MTDKVKSIISAQFSVAEDTLTLTTNLKTDLKADSIDLVELAMTLEEEFSLPEPADDAELPNMETIGDVLNYLKSIIG